MSPWSWTLPLLLVGACGAPDSGPAGPPPITPTPPPIAQDWIGVYGGSLIGQYEGADLHEAAVRLDISFDAAPDPQCPACVTVRLDDYFLLAGQRIDQPTQATFSYWDGTRMRTLELGKFSAGGASGNVLQGTLTVVDTAGGQSARTLEAELLVERRP